MRPSGCDRARREGGEVRPFYARPRVGGFRGMSFASHTLWIRHAAPRW